jgi:hypothetical protein
MKCWVDWMNHPHPGCLQRQPGFYLRLAAETFWQHFQNKSTRHRNRVLRTHYEARQFLPAFSETSR